MTERAGVQGNPVTQHTIPAAEPRPPVGSLHHVELWVPDLAHATAQWSWLLGQLGYAPLQDWPVGRSWRLGHTYLVIEQSPALTVPRPHQPTVDVIHISWHHDQVFKGAMRN